MNYPIVNEDRMFAYLWYETENEGECKFGQRWVNKNEDPLESCTKRVRDSVGVRKDLFDEGKVVIYKIWDITSYAKSINQFNKKAKVDDIIRSQIGFRKGTTGEVHTLPYYDMANRVNKFLAKLNNPLPTAGLSTGQYNMACDVLDAFDRGNNIVLAELCARFGKTIFSGVVATEANPQLTIVASYVKTVFTSFEVDITSFEQFKDIVHVSMEDEDYEDKINKALSENKQVFAYLSLCNGSKRQDRIDYLFGLGVSRFLIIDEADFGAHQKGQTDPLIKAFNTNDKALIMTGTNADRAASTWKVDSMISTTYFELLGHKKLAQV